MYSGYGTPFDEGGAWSFGYEFARNIVIFVVDHSSSSHTDKCNEFSVNYNAFGKSDILSNHYYLMSKNNMK